MLTIPRILGIYLDQSASSFYRIQVPLKNLNDAGYPQGWGSIDDVKDFAFDVYEVILISRPGPDERLLEVIASLRKDGKIVWLDYDDDLLNVPEHNKAHTIDRALLKEIISSANGLVVQNERLKELYSPYNSRIAVLPNLIDSESWPKTEKRYTQKLVVMLSGSDTHYYDWQIIAEPMKRIMEEFSDQVDFFVAGFMPDYLEEIATIHSAWAGLRFYPFIINDSDIALCPLEETLFNLGKSPIKAFEYAMASASVIGSPTQYGSLLKGRGLVAETEEEWYNHIRQLIVNKRERQDRAFRFRQYVLRYHDIQSRLHLVHQTYARLFYECAPPRTTAFTA